jgi:haloacetate dehalogenase
MVGDPAVRHAICEDYRAAVNEDLKLHATDRAQGRRLAAELIPGGLSQVRR